MKGKLTFGAGIALGFVLGSKSGRSAYDSLKAKSQEFWQNPAVQEKVHEATDMVKEKAPGVADRVTEAAKKAGSAATAKLPGNHGSGKDDGGTTGPTTTVGGTTGTTTLGDTSGTTLGDTTMSDPAQNDELGQSWTGEGGALPDEPAAINRDDDLRPPGV